MKTIIITGQTATGKTDLALSQAIQNNGEIVNFDSRQVYKKLDIITGKDINLSTFTAVKKLNGFDIGYYLIGQTKLWLYDVVDPKQYFSSFDFVTCAREVIEMIRLAGKVPILVGGTYLYLYHLLYKIETEHIPPDFLLRQKLNDKNITYLQDKLKNIDQVLFEHLNESDRNNPQRLIRKIELANHYKKRGVKVPTVMKYAYNDFFSSADIEYSGVVFKDKNLLKKTISNRVEKRLKQGAIEEVKSLIQNGYNEQDPGLKTIGYKQIFQFLKNKCSKEEAIQDWINKEVQYTKRQLTFMKKDPNLQWIYV